MPNKNTSWGPVAKWYHDLLSHPAGTYQHDVILPNIIRLVDPKPGMNVLDLACGSGFFLREFTKLGATVMGVDISPELVAIAKKACVDTTKFFVGSADHIPMVKDKSIDVILLILAIQNIENINGVFAECRRVLRKDGRLLVVVTHPAFRIPRGSSWGVDDMTGVRYRRIDAYMSDARVKIEMHPGDDPSIHTWTFHRPLQVYMKSLHKNGLCISRLEEWISNRKGPHGRTFATLEHARKEIPLFLFFEATCLP